MIDLLPCPFCGGEAAIDQLGTPTMSCVVICTECGCRHESGDVGGMNGRSWNARTGGVAQAPTVGVLHDIFITMRHARTFIISREKMNPTGVELWDKLFAQIEALQPSPVSSTERRDPVLHDERFPSASSVTSANQGGGK